MVTKEYNQTAKFSDPQNNPLIESMSFLAYRANPQYISQSLYNLWKFRKKNICTPLSSVALRIFGKSNGNFPYKNKGPINLLRETTTPKDNIFVTTGYPFGVVLRGEME